MNKNTAIIGGIAVIVVIIAAFSLGHGGKKNSTSNSTNTVTTNTNTVPAYAASLTIKDTSVTPPDFTVGLSQTIKVELINKGTLAHSFTFSKLDFNSGVIEPGATKVITFTTPSTAGHYDYFSDQRDDKAKGVFGTMIVQ